MEHATVHLLSRQDPTARFMGRTTPEGFMLWGEVRTETLVETVLEAIERLQQGETELAVHANCGSNLVAGGVLAGLATWAATRRQRRVSEQIPSALLAATVALMVAQPLGLLLQEQVTTSAHVDDVRLHEVVRSRMGSVTLHRVELLHDGSLTRSRV